MNTMLTARLHEIGAAMQLDRLPVPEPRPTDVLVEVKACNVVPNLGNVLTTYAEWFPYLPLPKLPAVFGLDSAGVVAEVGSLVTDVKVGDRVYVNPGLSCGACRACRRGEDPNCDSYTFMGYFSFGADGQDRFDAYPYGGLSEFLTAPQRNLVKLPDSVTFEQGARFGYLGTAFSALRKAGAGPGRTVLIDGISGTLGLGACLIALGLGVSRILGTGRNAALLQDVKDLAPDRIDVHAAGTGSLNDWVRERTDGDGADILIDSLGPGSPEESFVEALSSLGRGGVAVNIGGMMGRPALDLFALMCSQISVMGSLWFSTGEAQDMADMAGSGVLDLSIFEHHTFPLEKINSALADLPSRHGGFTNFICTP
ncbi:alcohol dehydrogenase catalytic domain-containing protein [Streptomyces sp. NL15-2K]|uniref:alcohol dehydrogenase catalytic domain-containing protein n=1 Tax=Streptomyces sp. NL15-2K TaxID=376149 RepID=UPI000F567EE6|nr:MULTISPECIES: alcohol dehydrogenase catalytic domain-containing protein [Actinomycetes]WKX14317.1 alcohol dehydrogenase catalytic domain-containing protein [Kutzneria buriramensis]GCB44622.1 alcohol dehydrogenase [Streptomyces sp. NL15-2K]